MYFEYDPARSFFKNKRASRWIGFWTKRPLPRRSSLGVWNFQNSYELLRASQNSKREWKSENLSRCRCRIRVNAVDELSPSILSIWYDSVRRDFFRYAKDGSDRKSYGDRDLSWYIIQNGYWVLRKSLVFLLVSTTDGRKRQSIFIFSYHTYTSAHAHTHTHIRRYNNIRKLYLWFMNLFARDPRRAQNVRFPFRRVVRYRLNDIVCIFFDGTGLRSDLFRRYGERTNNNRRVKFAFKHSSYDCV